jgi:ferrous iron transport protein B
MPCHQATVAKITNSVKRVATIGMPNTGKSTLFNRITGVNAFVGNWPGITVDLLQATIKVNDESVEFVDLPGIYDFNGFSDDEKIVRNFFAEFPVDLVVVVLNASQIDRQIRMPMQIKALGLPAIVILNMADEAKRYGIQIDVTQLSDRLQLPVFLISAKYGGGFARSMMAISRLLKQQTRSFQIAESETHLFKQKISNIEMEAVLSGAVQMPSLELITLTNRLDRLLLHPILGIPVFFLSMLATFWVIWNIGLPSQGLTSIVTDWILNTIVRLLINPFPQVIQDFVINGIWNGFSTVVSFLPLIVIFFLVMGVLEDSGYLSRAAYLMDGFMSKLGLDGRSFVMQMFGFGCNVPALMGTRVMRCQRIRWLTMLIIPFSLCSARLAVFVFIIAAVFPNNYGSFVLFSLYVLSFVAAFAAAALFSRTEMCKSNEPFILELPPYRFPTFKQVLLKGWGEVREFLRRATGFIVLGCVAVWFLTNLPTGETGLNTFGGQLGELLQPIMGAIGIDPYLTLALIFGFIAKEVVVGSLAVIYAMNADAVSHQIAMTVTPVQAYSFCIFCLLYTPCLTTIATVKGESKSWKFTWLTLGFSLVYAWLMSFIFYQGSSLLGFK